MKKYENLDLIGEEQYKKTNKVLRIVSICLISIGVLLFIFCLIGFIVSKNITPNNIMNGMIIGLIII